MPNPAVATIDPKQVYNEISRGRSHEFKEEVLRRGYRDSSSGYMAKYLGDRNFYLDDGFLADRDGENGNKSSFVLVGRHDAGFWGISPSVIRADYSGNFREVLEKNLKLDPEYFIKMSRYRRPFIAPVILLAGLQGLIITGSTLGGVAGLIAGVGFVRGMEIAGKGAIKRTAKERYGSDFDVEAVEAVLKEGLIE